MRTLTLLPPARLGGQVALGVDGSRYSVCCGAEGDEEGVTLRIDDTPRMRREGSGEDLLMRGEDLVVAVLTELVQQPRRALDVREEEGDGAAGELRHEREG